MFVMVVPVVAASQQLVGRRDVMFMGPGQLFLASKATAMLPALISVGAAATVVLAGKWPR
jgi:hypothetical protein